MRFHERYLVHLLISIVASIFIVLHLVDPALRIDAVSLALLIVAMLPWLGSVFKSIEFPGGGKVEYQDLQKAELAASKAGLLGSRLDQPESSSSPSFMAVAQEDPNLALAGLRIEIEKALRSMAANLGIRAERKGLGTLLHLLREKGALSQEQGSVLSDLSSLLNEAVHGAEVDPRSVEWAMDVGPRLLEGLQSAATKASGEL